MSGPFSFCDRVSVRFLNNTFGVEAAWRLSMCRFTVGLLVAGVMLAEIVLIVGPSRFGLEEVSSPDRLPQGHSNTKEIARVLYTDYVYAFEIAAVILLVGIVAAITLTARTRTDVKKLDPSKQIAVNKADRIRVVDLKQEPSE